MHILIQIAPATQAPRFPFFDRATLRYPGEIGAVFTGYNEICRLSRKGIYERRRVDRALGLVQTPRRLDEKVARYGNSQSFCGCPDSRFRRTTCKHSLSLLIAVRADSIMNSLRRGGP
jgi:hypothetical protein